MEGVARDSWATLNKNNGDTSKHQVRYADHRFWQTRSCYGSDGSWICITRWKPRRWRGGLNVWLPYDPPNFQRSHAPRLPSGGAGRSQGKTHAYGGSFSIAGVGLKSKAAYAGITKGSLGSRPWLRANAVVVGQWGALD